MKGKAPSSSDVTDRKVRLLVILAMPPTCIADVLVIFSKSREASSNFADACNEGALISRGNLWLPMTAFAQHTATEARTPIPVMPGLLKNLPDFVLSCNLPRCRFCFDSRPSIAYRLAAREFLSPAREVLI